MLLTAFAALTFACSPAPTAPEPPDVAPLFNVVLPSGDTLRLTLTYMCGNRWRVRNPHAHALEVTWDVFRTTARGALTLPARPEGAAFSETVFETPVAGTTRVFYQTRLVQTKAHGNRGCASLVATVPVTQQEPRKSFLDSIGSVTEPGTAIEWDRGLFAVAFHDGASVGQRRALFDSLGGRVVGGIGDVYYLHVPAASDFALIQQLTDAMGRHPLIRTFVPSMKTRIERFDTNTRTWRNGRPLASPDSCRSRGVPFTHTALRTIATSP